MRAGGGADLPLLPHPAPVRSPARVPGRAERHTPLGQPVNAPPAQAWPRPGAPPGTAPAGLPPPPRLPTAGRRPARRAPATPRLACDPPGRPGRNSSGGAEVRVQEIQKRGGGEEGGVWSAEGHGPRSTERGSLGRDTAQHPPPFFQAHTDEQVATTNARLMRGGAARHDQGEKGVWGRRGHGPQQKATTQGVEARASMRPRASRSRAARAGEPLMALSAASSAFSARRTASCSRSFSSRRNRSSGPASAPLAPPPSPPPPPPPPPPPRLTETTAHHQTSHMHTRGRDLQQGLASHTAPTHKARPVTRASYSVAGQGGDVAAWLPPHGPGADVAAARSKPRTVGAPGTCGLAGRRRAGGRVRGAAVVPGLARRAGQRTRAHAQTQVHVQA
jgi:hypothetical protein